MIPRPYQQEALTLALRAVEQHKSVGLVLPTGSGKSLIECQLIDELLKTLRFGECILVTSHLTDVVEQLQQFYAANGQGAKSAMRMSGRDKPRVSHKVVFATVQTLTSDRGMSYWRDDPMRQVCRYLLIDEAHLFGTDGYLKLIDALPGVKICGFSATPFRQNQFSFGQFETVAYAIDTHTLIAQGYLCPPKLFEMDMGDMPTSERFASIVRIWRDREAVRRLVSVVYLRSTAEAQEMRLVAENAGIRVEYVSGESSDRFCRELYARSRDSQVDMIVNCKKLETGIDIPNIGAIFMPFATKSVVVYLQRIGRALRPSPGKEMAHVYVYGSAPSIKDGTWKRLHRDAIYAKDPLDPIQNLEDDLEAMEDEGIPEERLAWTRNAIDACRLLIRDGLRPVAELLAEKKFPNKYSRAIREIVGRIHPADTSERNPISESQISLLTRKHGFTEADVLKLSAEEAEPLLVALEGYLQRNPFILQEGPHMGKHISDTPSMYRRYMRSEANIKVWQRWKKAGEPGETT